MSLSAEKRLTLETTIGYRFNDPSLLDLALCHRSVGARNNERLEFLGDSIVNHLVAEAIFHRYPNAPEGEMSRRRAHLVKGDTLALIARRMNLGDYLELGAGERKSGGHRRKSILADALEAIAAAILLDADFHVVKTAVLPWFDALINDEASFAADKDAKTALQEELQGKGYALPEYHLLTTRGEDHQKVFVVECRVPVLGLRETASASSRRKAEQTAAGQILDRMT